ncbi:MAG: site-specific DNA-methyltransferase [Alphaproteobacteria bacterium]|nr:site-specific DNA-methyltransferase [Alphaproteobacteria bacterium]
MRTAARPSSPDVAPEWPSAPRVRVSDLKSCEDDIAALKNSEIQGVVCHADSLDVLRKVKAQTVRLIYIDPPFNTGSAQVRRTTKAIRGGTGGQVGFQGRVYERRETSRLAYADSFDDYLGFLGARLAEARRVLTDDGSVFVHLDAREVHYVKVLMDELFGREAFVNEIIWAYDYGGRPKNRWPAKHDTILWYARDPKNYVFNYDAIDRIPYMAPALVGAEKAERGKTPTDVWWHTIVPTNSREKTGYPTQKPLGVLERIVKVHSDAGDLVMDFFAGSGTTGEAALRCHRRCLLVDDNEEAVALAKRRLDGLRLED